MTEIELDQFMTDYHHKDETIEVNCHWLQELLKLNTKNTRHNIQLRSTVADLQSKLDLYKELHAHYKNLTQTYENSRKVLKTRTWTYPEFTYKKRFYNEE